MPKDEEEEEDDLPNTGKRGKRVTFALKDIHHEIHEDIGEPRRPLRKTVPSYVLGHPLADYDAATENEVSM